MTTMKERMAEWTNDQSRFESLGEHIDMLAEAIGELWETLDRHATWITDAEVAGVEAIRALEKRVAELETFRVQHASYQATFRSHDPDCCININGRHGCNCGIEE